MGQSRPLFCLFLFFSRHNFNTNWKKHRWCAWDSNPGPQDGRCRQNHGALAATVNTVKSSGSVCTYILKNWVQMPSMIIILAFSIKMVINLNDFYRYVVKRTTIKQTRPGLTHTKNTTKTYVDKLQKLGRLNNEYFMVEFAQLSVARLENLLCKFMKISSREDALKILKRKTILPESCFSFWNVFNEKKQKSQFFQL